MRTSSCKVKSEKLCDLCTNVIMSYLVKHRECPTVCSLQVVHKHLCVVFNVQSLDDRALSAQGLNRRHFFNSEGLSEPVNQISRDVCRCEVVRDI